MASEVTSLIQKILDEDVKTGASASEAIMNKFAASVNALLDTNTVNVEFNAHGSYWITTTPDNNCDVEFLVPWDCEIVKMHFYHKVAGASGNCEVDVIRFPIGGGSSSIFSTRPIIPFSAGNDARIIQQFFPTILNLKTCTGGVLPILATNQLAANDVLKFNFINKQTANAEGVGLHLVIRPR
jgi:hypothetical protein